MIYKILIEIRKHMGVFYKLCEDIAKLDMFQSLAQASTAMHYTRPKFADYLEIIHARHPLLDFLCSVEPTANSVYASEDYNMNIITGPNGSGKSIFIRQILLIQVMAQVGCYVPAQSATLRVANRILARVYLEDNMACGASAFVLEMKEIEYFLTVLTRNTLIIVDELCRSTSVEEGTALAMALCEKLMTTPAFVFFTTHFKFLTKLRDLYFNVKTWQLETITETIDDQIILHFTYSIIPGVTSLEHYGFFLARGSWLENIIKYAEEVLRKLSTSQKKSSPHLRQVNPAARLKYDLEAEFKMLKAKKQLIQAVINQKLLEYQTNLENLGYHIDFSGPNHVFINENNNSSYYNEDLVQNLNNSDIHLLNRVIADDQNLHCYADDDDNEDNFSHSMNAALVKQQPYNLSVQPMINVDARSKFNESTDNFMKNTSANLSGISENVAYQLQPFNISYDDRQILVPEDHNNPQRNPGFINFAAENFGTFFNPEKNQQAVPNFNSNSFEYSFKLSQISTDNAEVNLQNSPFDNIFEPEIVLESMDGLEINYYMQKGDSIVRENVTPNSVSKHQNNSTAREYSLEQPEISAASNTELSRRYSIISVEEPSVSQLTLSDSCQNQNSTIFEDALSEIYESETNQSTCYIKTSRDFSEHIEYHPKTNLNQDSFLSVNELQFSLPLQQNIEKTSTPIPCNIYLSQSMEINNQRDVHQFRTSSSDDVSADKQPTKSTSTYSSDTIKWSMNVNPIKKDVEQNLNKSDSTNLKVTTGSAIHNLSKASNISKADITAIITDLQSCSEYFSDNEEWDSIDEEIKSKINQSKVSFNDNNNEQHNKNVSKEAKEVNIGNTNVTLDKTKVQLLNPEIKMPMCNTGNSTTILQNYRNSCPKSQTQNKINILQNICLVSKADPNKGLKSCHTQIDPRLIKYSTNIFQQCVGTLNETTQQNDQFCNKTTCQTNEGCHINYSGSCNVLQNNNNTTLSDYVQDINAPQLEQQEKNISLTQQQKEFKESQVHHPNYNEETTEMSICKAVQECNITSQSYIEKHDEIDPPIVLELSSNKFHLAANDVQTTQSKEKTVQLFCKNNQQLLNEKVNDQSQQYKCETPKSFETSDDVTKLERTFIKDRTHPVTSSDIMENKILQSEAEEGQKSLKESISDTNHQESARLRTKMAAFVSDVTQSDAKNFMLHSESKEELQVVEVPLNTSLEPLGDIHLELFSDESILNESINSLTTKSKYLLGAEIETGNERIETTNKNTVLDMQTNNININQEDEHEIPSSSEYFLPMQYSNKKNVNKSDINESSEQKSKRKRLGYVTQIQQADNSQLLLHSASPPTSEQLEKDQAIGTQSKFCKNSSDISDNQPDKIKDNNTTEELFCTPSSFASGSSTSKKSKWKPPFKTTSNRNDSSHGQSIKKKPKMLKFKDPKKLTKKEIELDFYEQDKRILENGSLTEYLEQQINRPSVKQLQQAKHIALFQKTETGVVVVPAKERKTKIKKRKFTVPLKVQPQNFDVSLFSDQNSDKFEKFMNFNSENKVPVRQEISAFQRISSDVAKKREDDQKTIANSQETTFSNFGKNIQDFKCELLQKLRTPISPDIFKKVSQNSESDNNSKRGYYTQNKDCIDNIIGKYLNTTSIFEDETIDSQNNCTEVQNSGSSVFSKQTLLLEDD